MCVPPKSSSLLTRLGKFAAGCHCGHLLPGIYDIPHKELRTIDDPLDLYGREEEEEVEGNGIYMCVRARVYCAVSCVCCVNGFNNFVPVDYVLVKKKERKK
jgi:hypothetical protein